MALISSGKTGEGVTEVFRHANENDYALPAVNVPLPAQAEQADEFVAPAPPWLYRSEGFAEDLAGNTSSDDGKDKLAAGLRMAAPALALCIGLAALLSLY